MVYESIDHGNDVNNAVPVVLFLVFHKNKCYCKKQIDPHFPWFSIDNRNDAIKRSKLCSETTRLRLVVLLEFSTLYDTISMVYKSVDHGKVWSIC